MIKKIKKHIQIVKNRLNNKSEANRLSSINNDYLNLIHKSIVTSKTNQFSKPDFDYFKSCERYRAELLQNDDVVTYEIFNSDRKAIVKDICAKAASSETWCKLIYSFIKTTASNSVFEIGTNLGISGSYILHALKGNPNRNFQTLEGLKKLCAIAEKEFNTIDPNKQYTIHQGLYDQTFDKAINSVNKIDCGFIDGNHQLKPTLEYFEKLEPLIKDHGILIFDDINWSDGMREAWTKIKQSNKINFSIDLYEIGIVVIDRSFKGPKESFAFHYDY